MNPSTVGAGVVDGGWFYVFASYALCWLVFAGYPLSLWFRRRAVAPPTLSERSP
jgi:hypothetical protein